MLTIMVQIAIVIVIVTVWVGVLVLLLGIKVGITRGLRRLREAPSETVRQKLIDDNAPFVMFMVVMTPLVLAFALLVTAFGLRAFGKL